MSTDKVYLPNGAEIIAKMQARDGSGLVLAKHIGPHPYVTWRFFGSNLKTTTWGHYHATLEEGVDSFIERMRTVMDEADV